MLNYLISKPVWIQDKNTEQKNHRDVLYLAMVSQKKYNYFYKLVSFVKDLPKLYEFGFLNIFVCFYEKLLLKSSTLKVLEGQLPYRERTLVNLIQQNSFKKLYNLNN